MAVSFVGGLICTLIFVVLVPVVCNMLIQPRIEDAVGDMNLSTAVVSLSSGTIVTLIMLIVMILFSAVIGGTAIMKRFGIVGVAALIIAYWALGRLTDAVIPVAVILLFVFWSYHKAGKRK